MLPQTNEQWLPCTPSPIFPSRVAPNRKQSTNLGSSLLKSRSASVMQLSELHQADGQGV
jgi:hypothetical protein